MSNSDADDADAAGAKGAAFYLVGGARDRRRKQALSRSKPQLF
jgi:hypothetical protein